MTDTTTIHQYTRSTGQVVEFRAGRFSAEIDLYRDGRFVRHLTVDLFVPGTLTTVSDPADVRRCQVACARAIESDDRADDGDLGRRVEGVSRTEQLDEQFPLSGRVEV